MLATPVGIVPYIVGVVAKVSLLRQLDASCVAAHPDGTQGVMNDGQEIGVCKNVCSGASVE